MLDKIRTMNDGDYEQFKEDIKNRNFKKIKEQFKKECSSTSPSTEENSAKTEA